MIRPFASFPVFPVDEKAWVAEFVQICKDLGCNSSYGSKQEAFARSVHDESEEGGSCEDQELTRFLHE